MSAAECEQLLGPCPVLRASLGIPDDDGEGMEGAGDRRQVVEGARDRQRFRGRRLAVGH
jgi:hypothetical protein